MLEVVEVDGIEDERARTVERERAVGLVGFHHEGACPHASDGHRSRFAADTPGGGSAEVLEKAGDEGGGGCLAVGPAHSDAVCGVDEGGEHFAAAADDETFSARCCEFGIVRRDSRCDDKFADVHFREGRACRDFREGRACRDLKVGRGMSNGHGNAALLQPARAGRGIKITARDRAALGF